MDRERAQLLWTSWEHPAALNRSRVHRVPPAGRVAACGARIPDGSRTVRGLGPHLLKYLEAEKCPRCLPAFSEQRRRRKRRTPPKHVPRKGQKDQNAAPLPKRRVAMYWRGRMVGGELLRE